MKVVKIIALIFCLVLLSVCLFSCDTEFNPKANSSDQRGTDSVESSNVGAEENKIIFNSLSVDGSNVRGEVANSVATFSFLDEIETHGNAEYTISLDIYGQMTVTTKTVALYEGDNTFYVFATVDGQSKLYTVTIRRRPIYTVMFDTQGDTSIKSQSIEENAYLNPPDAPTKKGYTFIGWTYDFSKPITSNLTILAKWTGNTYTITYDPDGDGINEDLTVTYGDEYTLELPEKKGYIFEGWYSGNKEYMSGIWNETNNVTLTAKWNDELGGDFIPAAGTSYVLHPVKIRKEAKESSSTVGTAAWGSVVQLIERNTLWSKIQFTDANSYARREGYIRNELLTANKKQATLVSLENPVTAKISGLGTTEAGIPFTLNVRTTPWNSSQSKYYTNINILPNIANEMYQVKDGDDVVKIGATEDGKWVYIRFAKYIGGVETVQWGWCMSQYVRVVGDPIDPPITDTPPIVEPIV